VKAKEELNEEKGGKTVCLLAAVENREGASESKNGITAQCSMHADVD
jgi:hypothetical protein